MTGITDIIITFPTSHCFKINILQNNIFTSITHTEKDYYASQVKADVFSNMLDSFLVLDILILHNMGIHHIYMHHI